MDKICSRAWNGARAIWLRIAATTPLPVGAISEPIAVDRLALVMKRGHPAADRLWAIADYRSLRSCRRRASWRRSVRTRRAACRSRREPPDCAHDAALYGCVGHRGGHKHDHDHLGSLRTALCGRLHRPHCAGHALADTELRVTLVWSHIHATDPLLAWFRGLVRDVARQVYENNGRLDT